MEEMTNRLAVAYDYAVNFEKQEELIGIQKEKILHKTLKYYISNDDTHHEIKIKKSNKGILYADVLVDNNIYEIQTRSFNNLRNKLTEFLQDYKVTIVYPLAHKKNLYKIEPTGEVIGPKKSPKTGKIFDVFKELYKIKSYLPHSNLSIKVLFLEIDEYRCVVEKKHSRSSGYIREVQIPKQIFKEVDLFDKNTYLELLSEYNLDEEFTSSSFAKATKIRKNLSTVVLNILTYLNVVERIGKQRNSYVYKKNLNN